MLAIFIIIFILFTPLPLKIKGEFINKDYDIFIYNKSVKKLITKKIKDRESNIEIKKVNDKNFKSKKKKTLNIKGLINSLKYNKFKLKFKFTGLIDYGLEDAFNVAMIFPLLNSMSPFLFLILSIPFSIKKYKLEINPRFNCNFIKIQFKSIIFLSIAKIIYMLILVFKNISKEEIENDRKSSN